jgi:hypothetical protein
MYYHEIFKQQVLHAPVYTYNWHTADDGCMEYM